MLECSGIPDDHETQPEFLKKYFVAPDALVPGMDTRGLRGIHIDIKRVSPGSYYATQGRKFEPDYSRIYTAGAAAQSDNFISSFPFDELDKFPEACKRLKGQVIIDLGAGKIPVLYMNILGIQPKGYIAVEPYHADDLLKNFEALARKKGDFIEFGPFPNIEDVEWEDLAPGMSMSGEPPPKREYKDEEYVEYPTDPVAHRFAGFFENTDANDTRKTPVPFAIVQEDMLTLLKRLPNNSVSLFASGIDWDIMGLLNFEDPQKRKGSQEYLDAVNKECYRVLDPKGVFIRNRQPLGGENILWPTNEKGKMLIWDTTPDGFCFAYKTKQEEWGE